MRASGPAVDATGIGPGLLGLARSCARATGVRRNIGAISESVGEYGNHVVLVTPIEEMLGDQPPAPTPRPRQPGALRSARPLAGRSPSPGSRRARATCSSGRRAAGKRTVLAAPAGPLGGFPQQPLVPGAAVAATLASGDIALGAIGTVTYRDGARIWAFGHPFDALGRRALILEDAYVFGVISNPLAIPEIGAGTYKLTSAGGHIQGMVSSDTVGVDRRHGRRHARRRSR